MHISDINYEDLNDENIFNDKDPFLNRISNWMPKIIQAVFLILSAFSLFILIGLIAIMWMLFLVWALRNNIILFVIGTIITGLVLFVLYKRQRRIDRKKRKGISAFAKSNNWSYGQAGSLIKNFYGGAKIRSSAENNALLYSIKGDIDENRFELLVGWKTDKTSQLEYLNPELYIEVKKELPNALLVSRNVTDDSKIFDSMFLNYETAQKISLEGDFDKYFQLYVPKGEHIEAMSLISPDFMLDLKEFINDFSVEMAGNIIVITPKISSSETISKHMIKNIFKTSELLSKNI